MAKRVICDGCFEVITDNPNERGLVVRRDYCDKCVEMVDEYLRLIDELHTKLAAQWAEGLSELRRDYLALVEVLPDFQQKEPDEEAA